MIRYAFPVYLLFLLAACGTKKYVAATHSNGVPEVIVFMTGKGADAVKVMEKVYYENGNLEYVGRFEKGVEQGEWIYYYEDGSKKFVEYWEKGLEHGIHYEYMPDGQVRYELHYTHGKLIETIDKMDAP